MASTKYLLIGGGLASDEAIKAIRKLDQSGSITLVGQEPHLPYDRPPMTKEYLRGEKPREELFFNSPDHYKQLGVKTMFGVRVESLDAKVKRATVAGGEQITYEKALLATGGTPMRLDLQGAGLSGVYTLRTLDDCDAIKKAGVPGKRAVLVGSGFIGIEAACSLTKLGVKVTVIESASRIWSRFADATLASYFQKYCEASGITFITNDQVTEINGEGAVSGVTTSSGKEISADFVVLSMGIRPNVELAQAAGLRLDNGVVVNEKLQSSDTDIFAAGDIANYPDPWFGAHRRVEHWGQAEYTGQVAGENMAGGNVKYDLLTYVWSEVFDLHLEFAGNEAENDTVVLRGRTETDSFIVLFLMGGKLTAYFAVNADKKDFEPLQQMIRDKKDLSGAVRKLEDPSVPLQSL